MFCNKCGKENPNGAKFCSKCGNLLIVADFKIHSDQTVKVYKSPKLQSSSKDDTFLNSLEKAFEYFSEKSAQYEVFEFLSKKTIYGPRPGRYIKAGIVCFIIIFLHLMTVDVSGVVTDFEFFLNELILPSIIVFFILLLIYFFFQKRFNNKLNDLKKRYNEVKEDLYDYYNKYNNPPISFEYSNPKIIDKLVYLIRAGRADNVKEAINCLIDDTHKEEMLRMQMEVNKNISKAKDAAQSAALFSAADLLNNTRK